MFFPPRWEEDEAGVLAPAVENFTSRSRWVTSVTTLYVPYVQVQHRQLGVTRLLGGKLLSVQTTVIYICAGNTGLVTLTFGGLTTAHAWRLFTTATSLPLDFWSLDQKSIQDKTMGNKNKKMDQENK